MTRRAVSAAGVALLVLLGGSVAASAQRGRPFAGTVDVVEVEIPVEVRERDGTPVRGLSAADFRVLDKGRERPIVRFEAIDLATGGQEARPADAPRAGLARPRYILLLFDLTFSSPLAITRARTAARDVVLDALHESDLVAVATLTAEEGPRLLVTFTPDRAQVARAIDSLSFDRARQARAVDPLRFLLPLAPAVSPDAMVTRGDAGAEIRQELDESGIEHLRVLGESVERTTRRADASRVVEWARGLAVLARHLAAVEGRKQVLLFSEGFDSRLLLGRTDLTGDRVQEEGFLLMSGEFWRVDSDARYGSTTLLGESTRLVEELKRADCVVQSVDLGGLRAAGQGSGFGRSQGEEGLFFLANESGGQLFGDTNDLSSQMRSVLERTATSYLLTITVESVPLDGAWRPLKVDLRGRRGLRVAHRAGWYAPRPFPEIHPFERDLLAAEKIALGAEHREVGVSVLAASFRTGLEHAYVPVILEIDGASLLGDGDDPTRFDIYTYVLTRDGEFRSYFHRELSLAPERSRERLRRGGIKYYGHFELDPGEYILRVLVREAGQGRTGTAQYALHVPDFTAAPATLLPPFFFDSPGRWTLLREQTATGPDGSVVYPFVVAGEPYVPQALARPRPGERLRFCLVGYNLGDGDLALEAFWSNGGEEVPLRLSARPQATAYDDYHQWLGELQLAGLPAGVHRVVMVLVDAASGRRVASAEGAVRVEG
jgi:VWFA-related protein